MSMYRQLNTTLMQKIRVYRDQRKLATNLISKTGSKSAGGGGTGAKVSAHLAFEALSVAEQNNVMQAFVASEERKGASNNAGTSGEKEVVHEGRKYFLVPNGGGLYCTLKDLKKGKGDVTVNQQIYTLRIIKKVPKVYVYESSSVKDANKTGPVAAFAVCSCGSYYHAANRCLNRDF